MPTATDFILIEQLEIGMIIGVHAWEKRAPRPLVLDLELGIDIHSAAASDKLRDAVNYRAVADEILELGRSRSFQLIETLAETIARLLFERFPITALKMTIYKPGAVPEAKTVGVRIERLREDYAVCGR
ncbi:MAG: folB [Nevskia sp.]|nr:folB [Nevskia sp.]